MSRRRCIVVLLLLTALLAAGCSRSGGTDTSAQDEPTEPRANAQDLRVAVGDDPFLANPANPDIGIRAAGPNPGIFETLTRMSSTFGAEPALAVRWESPSPRTWRFFLRPNVTFHNGTPFDAGAVVTNLNETIARRQTRPRGLDPGTAKATAPDVVEVNLTQDNTRLPEQLANPAMAMIAPGTRPGAGDTPETTPVGTGPFSFVSYTKGTELKVKANEKYWAGPPQLRTLTFRFGPERDVSRLLATRQVEIAGMVAYSNLASVSGRTDRNVASRPAQAAYFLLNTGGTEEWSTLKDDNVRRAVAETVDRKELTKAGWEDHGEDSTTLIPKIVLGADAADRIRPLPQNLNEARKALDAAGWQATLPNGMRAKDDKPLVLNLLLSRPADQDKLANALKAELAQVGIGMQIQDPAPDTPFTKVNNTTFDMFLDVRAQDDANPCALCRFFTIKSGNQFLAYSTAVGGGPKADDAYDRIFSSPSIDTARRGAADIIQTVTAERVTAISIAALKTEWLISPRVRGFEPAVLAGDQHWEGVFLTV